MSKSGLSRQISDKVRHEVTAGHSRLNFPKQRPKKSNKNLNIKINSYEELFIKLKNF